MDHLRWIIKKESKGLADGKMEIPTEPMANVPKRKNDMGVLGTQIDLVSELDAKYMENEDEFKENARTLLRRREDCGHSSIYQRMQPFFRPELAQLKSERIDVLIEFVVEGGTAEVVSG